MTTTPTEAAAEIVEILASIKALTERKQSLQAVISNAIDLGELDSCLMADDKGYRLDNIRVCPVLRSTWDYGPEAKSEIEEIQERAKVEGLAVEKVSVSYRFSVIKND